MPAKKSASKKATGGRKYSPESSASVEREMKAMKEGKLRSGSGQKVTNPKQAIAIGLSEARREGAEQPDPPQGTASAGKANSDKKAAAKSSGKTSGRSAAKKTPAKKAATKKSATKKSAAKKSSQK